MVSYDPRPSEEPEDASANPALHLPWEIIEQALADGRLQRKGWRRFKPEQCPAARACPECGRQGAALTWIYFSNGQECWMAECGLEGWAVVCMECRKQADFFPTLMS